MHAYAHAEQARARRRGFLRAYYATNAQIARMFDGAAKRAGEQFWRMPLLEDMRNQLRSDMAAIKHTDDRWEGSTTGALFLREFVGDVPFIHCDLAGSALADKPYALRTKGGSGQAVLTSRRLAETMDRRSGFVIRRTLLKHPRVTWPAGRTDRVPQDRLRTTRTTSTACTVCPGFRTRCDRPTGAACPWRCAWGWQDTPHRSQGLSISSNETVDGAEQGCKRRTPGIAGSSDREPHDGSA